MLTPVVSTVCTWTGNLTVATPSRVDPLRGITLRAAGGFYGAFGRSTMSIWIFTVPDKSTVMPAVAPGLFPMAQLLRFTRSSVLEIVDEDYVVGYGPPATIR